MNRRIIAAQRIILTALAAAVVFLSLLPTLGWRWHDLLPEHQHVFLGTMQQHSHAELTLASPVCADCHTTGALHMPDLGVLQIAAITASLAPTTYLPIPDELSARVIALSLRFLSPDLPRFDPPPKKA